MNPLATLLGADRVQIVPQPLAERLFAVCDMAKVALMPCSACTHTCLAGLLAGLWRAPTAATTATTASQEGPRSAATSARATGTAHS